MLPLKKSAIVASVPDEGSAECLHVSRHYTTGIQHLKPILRTLCNHTRRLAPAIKSSSGPHHHGKIKHWALPTPRLPNYLENRLRPIKVRQWTAEWK